MTNVIHFPKSVKIPRMKKGEAHWEGINGEENNAHVVGKNETYDT